MRFLIVLIFGFFSISNAIGSDASQSSIYLGSREGDPASIVENVSTIHGDYSEVEVDLIVPGPDSLVLSRFYTSKDSLSATSLGGWRFYPQCTLSVQKDSKKKTFSSAEGKFDRTYVNVGMAEGSILTYVGWQNTTNEKAKALFKVDVDDQIFCMANTARGNTHAWTNQKNNELYFHAENNFFELILSSGGKRFYMKHPLVEFYVLEKEVLPSGNRIFYEYDDQGRPIFIKMTNSGEEKVLSWIKVQYEKTVRVDTSDRQTVEYQFDQDPSGQVLLSKVIRSHKFSLQYQYQVIGSSALLIKKEIPEGRYTEIEYYADNANKSRVRSVTSPVSSAEVGCTKFAYSFEFDGSGFTEIQGPSNQKTVHRYNEDLQLICVEEYLDGSVYRVQRNQWGKSGDICNLIQTSIEDGSGNVFYTKILSYDDRGNVLEEREYGNFTGANPYPLVVDQDGIPDSTQECHVKTYSYSTTKDFDVVYQKDAKDSGLRLCYKKGTNWLLRKALLRKNTCEKRWFFDYNEDGVLIQVMVDDGDTLDSKSTSFNYLPQRLITQMTPKKEFPNVGAPEVIEEKYLDIEEKKEVLLKRVVNHFDLEGNITQQDIYDANSAYRYSLKRAYENGLLTMETDASGNETHYTYDANHNLIAQENSATGTSFEYGYDLQNRLTYTAEKAGGHVFETHASYDALGYKLSETDKFGNETIFTYDDLGRVQTITYPELRDEESAYFKPTYTYQYDFFDHVTAITDPYGGFTKKSNTTRGTPINVQYPDGSQELFKYDLEGSLHRHCNKDGTVRVFEYDYLGRLSHIEHYGRSQKQPGTWLSSVHYNYDVFHMTSEKDEEENATQYDYDDAGRLSSLSKDSKKVEFFYDSLGQTNGVKKWKSSNAFTLEVQEHDFQGNVIEERIEDSGGKVLSKTQYSHDKAGRLKEVVGYPQNQMSILKKYDYDRFGRLSRITDAFNQVTEIIYEDGYINQWGQRVFKKITIDPLGNKLEEIYDPASHLVEVCRRNKAGEILSLSEFFSDALSNEVCRKDAVVSSGNTSRAFTTRKSYNPGNNLQTLILAAGTSDEKAFAYEYNSYGDISSKLSPGAETPITYQYNNTGRVNSISYKEDSSQKEMVHKLTYDKKGNITEVEMGSTHTLHYKFDPNNQQTSEEIKDEFGSYQLSCSYDGEGLIKSIKLPDGSFIEYEYEGPFVKRVTRFSKEKEERYQYKIVSRDLMGNILEEILPGYAGGRAQSWDHAGRRVRISTDFFQDTIPEGGYDPLDNIKNRETTLDDEKNISSYDYNALSQLISEKGEIERSYSYDSIGNRLKKNNSSYKINDCNQIIEADGVSYTFDPNGNLASKTVQGETWVFEHNVFNQLILIKDPHQTSIAFTYDLQGKRLSKKIEGKGRSGVFRYFYLGQTEIGCIDKKGAITELRVPSNPNHPESSSYISFEIQKEAYVPIYDLQGNVACLVDSQRRKIIESYRYSVFGEEEIINHRGREIVNSAVGNPWRYRGNRTDQETGLICIGCRYYDPEIGRWISPDPAGYLDGPDLYVYCRNNPLTYIDYFGLASEKNGSPVDEKYFYGEYEPRCDCERHRDCKRGGDIANALNGYSSFNLTSLYGFSMDIFTHPRFQGSIQALGGLAEASAGGLATLGTGGFAAPIGWPVLAHGLDQFITGISTAITGRYRDAVTERFLLKIGMSPEWVPFANNLASASFTVGAISFVRNGLIRITPNMHLTTSSPAGINSISQELALGQRANINSAVSLRSKLSGLQKAQKSAVRVRNLPDGRIRYYSLEVPASKQGLTRGVSYVTEWNLNNGQVRSWMESYNHFAEVNRVHPKMINGQTLNSMHYPPIGSELRIK
ncbi:MAG: tRNA nuclease WapA [Chlamydiae bacterium]|nr:tRNA nuclease WapA [Chlamydiota bacterium]